MTDRTTQPADGIGINPLYSGATFLWNAIAPTKNQINSATATLKGTTVSGGADGQYQMFNTAEGQMTFAQATPSGAYTVVLGLAMPAESGGGKIFSLGNALRVELRRSTGGVYLNVFHTGVAAATSYVIGTTAPNSEMWTLVLRYTGTVLHQYVLNGAGVAETTNTDTIGFAGAQSEILLGDTFAVDGLYAAVVIPSDVGNTEAVALRDNLWRAFAPAGGGGDTVTANLGTATASGFAAAIAVSVAIACSLGGATASGHQALISTGSNVTINTTLGTATAAGHSASVASSGSATITTDIFKNNTGTVLATTTIPKLSALKLSDMTLAASWTNQTTNGSGVLSLTGDMTAATDYLLVVSSTDGASVGVKKYTAT